MSKRQKNRILALLLAFVLVLSVINLPGRATATEETIVVEQSEEQTELQTETTELTEEDKVTQDEELPATDEILTEEQTEEQTEELTEVEASEAVSEEIVEAVSEEASEEDVEEDAEENMPAMVPAEATFSARNPIRAQVSTLPDEEEEDGPFFIQENEQDLSYPGTRNIEFEYENFKYTITVPESIRVHAEANTGVKANDFYGTNAYPANGTKYEPDLQSLAANIRYTFPGKQESSGGNNYWIPQAVYPRTVDGDITDTNAGNYFDNVSMSLLSNNANGGVFRAGNVWCCNASDRRDDGIKIDSANLYLVTDTKHYKIIVIDDNPFIFIPYYRTGLEGTNTFGNQQHIAVSGYLRFGFETKRSYFVALKKVDDAGNPMRGVSFDIKVDKVPYGVDTVEYERKNGAYTATRESRVWTENFYNATTNETIRLYKHDKAEYAQLAQDYPGVAIIFLGVYDAGQKPTVTVKEHWTKKLYTNPNGFPDPADYPDPKDYTVVSANEYTFLASQIYETRDEAMENAASNPGVTWVNMEKGSLTVNKVYTDAAKACLISKDRYGNLTYENPNFSLSGALYGVFLTRANAANEVNAIAGFTTDADGKGKVTYVTGDLTGLNTYKLEGLPQGKYFVKELTPSLNCELDTNIYDVNVARNQNSEVTSSVISGENITIDPVQIEIRKQNAAGDVMANNGTFDLTGAQFTIKYWPYDNNMSYTPAQFIAWAAQGWQPQRTWVFETKMENGEYRIRFSDFFKVDGDDLWYDENNYPGIPAGWITIEETKAPDGFTLEGGKYYHRKSDGTTETLDGNMLVVKIDDAGKLIVNNSKTADDTLVLNDSNVPKRADIEIRKTDENGDPIEGVLFEIKNNDTQEAHIVATDADGYYSTAASYQKHSVNTGYYDGGKEYDGTKAGIWFAKNTSGIDNRVSEKADAYGALCPGSYTVTELYCEATKGKQLDDPQTYTVTGDETTVHTFSFENYPAPEFSTVLLCTETGDHVVAQTTNATLVDTVSYKYLKANTQYTLVSSLMEKDLTTKNVTPYLDQSGNPMVQTKTFTTSATGKYVSDDETVTFTGIDGTALPGKAIVCYQKLYLGASVPADDAQALQYPGYPADVKFFPMAEEDPNNAKQTVTAVTGETDAYFVDTTKTANSVGTVTLIDEITYKGLIVGETYKATGYLYLIPENDPDDKVYTDAELESMRAKDAQGNYITASETFVAESVEGSVKVTFTFDATDVVSETEREMVIFEDVSTVPGNIRVFTHADVHDGRQRVYFPKLKTTAKSINDRKEVLASEGKFIDTVEIKKIVPNKDYTLEGVVMDRETKAPLMLNGKELTATVKFTAPDGNKKRGVSTTVDVEFNIPAGCEDEFAGHQLVVFERLINEAGKIAAEHDDFDDEEQQLVTPLIGTTMTDAKNGTHVSYPDETVELVDVVAYKGLLPGKSYVMDGKLYRKDTGKALLDVNGDEITASEEFIADADGEGEVSLTFTFNAKLLFMDKISVVAFESCKSLPDRFEVAVHADIEDDSQTVDYPTVGTSAGLVQKNKTENNVTISVVDVLTYKNLNTNYTYVARGWLVDQKGNKVVINSKEISAETTFKPTKKDGEVQVTFPDFVVNRYTRLSYVVFEEVYVVNGDEYLVGEHKDLTDTLQTVSYHDEKMKTTLKDKVTGTHMAYPKNEVITLVDTVEYFGLIPGKEYTMKGVLHRRDNGKPLTDENGNEITAEADFIADESGKGVVAMTFTFNSSLLVKKPTSVVAFERCLTKPGKIEVCAHADIEDEDQTVDFPEVNTKASLSFEKAGGDTVTFSVADIVMFKKLSTEYSYTIKGWLVDKDGNKVVINDVELSAEKTFTPVTSDGTVDMIFPEFSVPRYSKFSYVIFEEIYVNKVEEDGTVTTKLIAEHKELTDSDQKVEYSLAPVTGDDTPILPLILLMLLAAAGLGMIIWQKKRIQ